MYPHAAAPYGTIAAVVRARPRRRRAFLLQACWFPVMRPPAPSHLRAHKYENCSSSPARAPREPRAVCPLLRHDALLRWFHLTSSPRTSSRHYSRTPHQEPRSPRVCVRRFPSAVSTSRSPREARGAVLVPALWRCGVSSGYRPVRRGPAGRRRAPGLRVHEDATRCARAPPACHAFPPSCPLGFGVRGVPLTREHPPRHGAARSGDVRTTDSLGLASVPVRDLAPPPCTPFSSIAPRAAARVPGWALGRCAHAVARTHAAIPGWAKVHEYSRRQSTSSPSIHLVLHLRAPVYCPIFPAAKCALPPQSPAESPAHVRGCAPTPPPPPCPVFLFFLCAGFAARTPCDWDTASSGPGNRCQCRPLRTGAAAQSGDAHAQTGTPPRLAPTLPQNLPARASCQRLSDRRATPVCDACPCTRPSVFHTRQASRGRSGDSARPAGQVRGVRASLCARRALARCPRAGVQRAFAAV
ncbi:hypothetical protein AcW1_007818 [Taiwanofungus camphoratus]|nr:hypothetical protein AcW1_007818 [Antrodia cinnamomea]